MQTSTLLELRNKIKYKKPDFIRQDYQRRKRLGRKLKWRKPKGIHSKIRHHFKGRRKMPSPGYKSPAKIRGLHSSGLKMIMVHTLSQMEKIDNKVEGIVIAGTVGMKKRLELFRKAKQLNIKVLNLNVDEEIKYIEDYINLKKKKIEIKKGEKPKETKEAKKEEQKEQKLSDEEKKEAEEKEKQKVLTKRM